jgi:hypothetical protein
MQASDQGKIEISDAADGSGFRAVESGIFKVKSLEVTAPATGANIKLGTIAAIEWTKSSNVASVKIEVSTDGGSTYGAPIATGQTGTSYNGWMPAAASQQYKIKITDEADNSVIGESGIFAVSELTITYPLAGSKLQAGTQRQITWSGLNYVKIEVYNGSSWSEIANNYNGNSYNWTVPTTTGNQYKIRISAANNPSFSEESGVFIVNNIVVTQPNSGTEIWMAGKSYEIKWNGQYLDNVTIQYSSDGGNNYTTIANNINGSLGTYIWNIPTNQPITSNYLIRILEQGSNTRTKDSSDAQFKLAKLRLDSPNGGEQLQVGRNFNITWTSQNINNVRLQYSTDDGNNWVTIINSIPANSSPYAWINIQIEAKSDRARIRISDANDPTFDRSDISDQSFIIKYLQVTQPNGGESWQTGAIYKIKWNSDYIGNVNIYHNNGVGENPIDGLQNIPASAGIMGVDWIVPGATGTNQNKIKIVDASNSAIYDETDGYFSITTLQILKPNGGERIQAGKPYTIEWFSIGIQNVKIEYTLDGVNWGVVTSSTPADNYQYVWNVPSDTSSNNQARIRITDLYDGTSYKVSANTFTVVKLKVISPNGNENWQKGLAKKIRWQSENANNLTILYAANGVDFNYTIADNITSSVKEYIWMVDQNATQNAKIKIQEKNNQNISDESDNVFRISEFRLITPNGGEKWQAGKTKRIQWANSSNITNVRIEFSTNGGTTFNTAQPITMNWATGTSGGYFDWNIPQTITASSNFKIRIIDANSPTIIDTSDAVFEIRKLKLTEPNDNNLVYQAGSTQKIKWTYELVNNVKIYYSSDNGGSWPIQLTNPTTPASTGTSGFNWVVPSNSGTFHRIKIVDAETDSIFWISENPFSISTLALIEPNGNENWLAGTRRKIKWTSSGVSNVKIEYTLDGNNWALITNSASASMGEFEWDLPNDTSSNNARIRLTAVENNQITYTSANPFTISKIKILAPNGGENLLANSSYEIKWQSRYAGLINIWYASDGNNFTTQIATGVNSNSLTTYVWNPVPNVVTQSGKIKIESQSDVSNNYVISAGAFRISKLAITVPTSSSKWQVGKTFAIRWNYQGPTDAKVKIEYSTDNGATWSSPIVTNYDAINGEYNWTIPSAARSTQAKIRITDINYPLITSTSSSFTIFNLSLVAPNGGEIWQKNSPQTIQWISENINNLKIEYSPNNGSTWEVIAASAPAASQSYTWIVDRNPNTQSKIKISDVDNPNIADSSDSPFIISELRITSPTSLDHWQSGTIKIIEWECSGIATIKLEYSTDNGLSWNNIINSYDANEKSYQWSIPENIHSKEAKIKITNNHNPIIYHVSDQFTIKRIKLISPNGGEFFMSSRTYPIGFEIGSIDNVKIVYSTDDFATSSTIVETYSVTNGINNYAWNVPSNLANNNVKIRIFDVVKNEIRTQSIGSFKVGSVSLTSPIGGENWQAGSSKNITWTKSANVTTVNIAYTTDDGLNFVTIASNQPGTVYNWTIPNGLASTNVKIRISDAASNNQIFSMSPNAFTISRLFLISPNGGERWRAGSTKSITWDRSSNINNVNLQYAIVSNPTESDWIDIIASTPASSGSYNWNIPEALSTVNAKIRIRFVSNTTIQDVSDNSFAIGYIQISQPTGANVWQAGKEYQIVWNASSSVSNLKIEYSTNAGGTYAIITNSIAANSSPYNWTVPEEISSSECIVKITDVQSSEIFAVSQQFTISKIKLISPNGGEIVSAGNNLLIEWQTGSVINTVKLEYSSNNGDTWNLIQDNIPAFPTSYNWFVPTTAPAGNRYLIKVSDQYNPNIFDVSDATFTISNLRVVYPNGNEFLQARKTYKIRWQSDYIDNVKIEYSLNAGGQWNVIVNSTSASSGEYEWRIPDGSFTNEARIKISSVSNPNTFDISDNNFTISDLRITSPVGGENWQAGSQQSIAWFARNTGNLRILYASNGVNFLTTIQDNVNPNSGAIVWNLPLSVTNQARIKIVDISRPSINDSSELFTISNLQVIVPNGSERWQAGKTHTIEWTKNFINEVRIDYTTNNGGSWNNIVASVSGNSYNWTIPDLLVSNNVKIRISDVNNINTKDESDNSFTIARLVLQEPLDGDYLQAGKVHTIKWQSLYVNQIKIQYSSNNGTNWFDIYDPVDASLGQFNWNIPSDYSSKQFKIRLIDKQASYINSQNIGTFTVGRVILTSPSGSVRWQEGKQYTISWLHSSSVDYVRLDYSTDGGGTWNPIVASTPASSLNYNWTVPLNIASTTAKVRVSDAASNLKIKDESGVVFTISKLVVTSPNGNEKWQAGSTRNITWINSDDIDFVDLYYTSDNGLNWNKINSTPFAAASASYSWNIPNDISSNQCKVKITLAGNTSISDESNNNFTISKLRLITPNGNENWMIGQTRDITWVVDSAISNIKISLSTNNGNSWQTIIASTENDGAYNWTVSPNTLSSNNCLIRISYTSDDEFNDISDNVFAISNLRLLTPAGGENIQAGSQFTIQWSEGGAISKIKLELTTNNGGTWSTIIDDYNAASGSYNWNVGAGLSSTQCRIRISDNSRSEFVRTSELFTIRNLVLTAPQSGEYLQAGSNYNITWNASSSINNVIIEFSTNSGGDWTELFVVSASSGVKSWLVPDINTSEAIIRIKDEANPSIVSNSGTFIIAKLQIISPIGGEFWQNNTVKTIRWQSYNVNSVNIYYANNITNYVLIASNVNALAGSYNWTTANVPTDKARIKIEFAGQNHIKTESALFTIAKLELSVPNGGEYWQAGTQKTIQWNSNYINTLNIDYFDGTSWNNIASNVDASLGLYQWNVPSGYSNSSARIRIVSSIYPEIKDSSDNPFKIGWITVTAPASGVNWQAGTTQNITWNNSSSIAAVKIEYSSDNGTNWQTIISSTSTGPSSGSYAWNLPSNLSTAVAKVRVSDAPSNGQIYGENVNVFTITNLKLTSPVGGEYWQAGTIRSISWNASDNITSIKIEFSTDNGATWSTIVNSTSAGAGSYNWFIPNLTSTLNGLIKISDVYQPHVKDSSSNKFTIGWIRVVSPNGAENWQVDSIKQIRWQNSSSVLAVKIEYTTDNGNTWFTITNSTPAFSGRFDWTVPDNPTLQGKIRISDALSNNNIKDESDNFFIISKLKILEPTAGFNWLASSQKTIKWQSSSNINNLVIKLSTNNGVTWNIDVGTVIAAPGLYNWTIPAGINSNLCRIKIYDPLYPEIASISPIFNIYYPYLELQSPNGGELWQAGKNYQIKWASSLINLVKIEVSLDNGQNFAKIADSIPAVNKEYNWTIPYGTSSNNALVKISDSENPTVLITSASTFTIKSILLVTPNGGENWATGTIQTISWLAGQNTNAIDLYYTSNNGISWEPLASNILASQNNYNWQIPDNVSSTSCKVRVVDRNSTTIYDESDNLFTLSALNLIAPNGGEKWRSGTTRQINWVAGSSVPFIDIEYTTNNGSSWNAIKVSHPASQKPYNWIIPEGITSNNCKVRIKSSANPNIFDISDNVFTIYNLNILSPIGGEEWQVGRIRTIAWSSSDLGNFRLQYSTDNGQSWILIINSIPSTAGQFEWTIPFTPSDSCRIRITSTTDQGIDAISNVFTIFRPNITIISPNGGEMWQTGKTYQIKWQSSRVNNVKIEYSLNDGIDWLPIAQSVPATNYFYNWYIPFTRYSQQAKIKITDVDNTDVWDVSDVSFMISEIRVVAPNGGENWQEGNSYQIVWETSPNIINIRIDYRISEESEWINIYPTIAAALKSANWVIPSGIVSTACRVRIVDVSNPVFRDSSDNLFTIGKLKVISPNGGEKYQAGSSTFIAWNSGTNIENVKIEYSLNGISNWNVIESAYPAASGKYLWTIPSNLSSRNVKVRISDALNSNINDISDSVFTIAKLTLTSPNGAEHLPAGNNWLVTWSSEFINRINIEFSTNAGITWIAVANSIDANVGSYNWTLPSNISTFDALVRIIDSEAPAIKDTSNNTFKIGWLQVIAPNGGEVWQSGTSKEILWTRSSTVSDVKIEYSTNYGAEWKLISSSVPANSGRFEWSIPNNIFSQKARIRVSDAAYASVMDTSDAPFIISFLRLITPAEGEVWRVGSQQTISWLHSPDITNVNLQFSMNDGETWENITTNYSAASGQYLWNVPTDFVSNTCRIRILNSSNLQIQFTSGKFTIYDLKLKLTRPTGGEIWQAGTTQKIIWNPSYVVTAILEYTTNNGISWNLISNNVTVSAGEFLWNIPATIASNDCRIRISDRTNPTLVKDSSLSTFKIGNIRLTSPAGGEIWPAGATKYITWNATPNVTAVKIEFSTNNGENWIVITPSVGAASGQYAWSLPLATSEAARIRISDASSFYSIKDSSANTFTISSIKIVRPANGDFLHAGRPNIIEWNRSNDIANVKIEISTNNGMSWTTIANNVSAGIGRFIWNIPEALYSDQCKIRVSNTASLEVKDSTAGLFRIGSIIVVKPNGGERFHEGTLQTIEWSHSPNISYVDIHYTTNNGAAWLPIQNGIAAANRAYAWVVPATASELCRIRVRDALNNNFFDLSDTTFTISSLRVVYPNGGEILRVGNSYDIKWEGGNIEFVKIEISTNNGVTYSTIVNAHPGNTFKYSWKVSGFVSSNVIIRISDASFPNRQDISDNKFVIVRLDLLRPNETLGWQAGKQEEIRWNAAEIDTIAVYFSSDNGETWRFEFVEKASTSSRMWTVPNIYSRFCRIKIAHKNYPDVYDISDTTFAIGAFPVVTKFAPYQSGVIRLISRTSTPEVLSVVKFKISTDGGFNWSNANLLNYPANITGVRIDTLKWNSKIELPDYEDLVKAMITYRSNYNYDYNVIVDSIGVDNLSPRFNQSSVKFVMNPNKFGWDAVRVSWNSGEDLNGPISYKLQVFNYQNVLLSSNITVGTNYTINALHNSRSYKVVLIVADKLGNSTTYEFNNVKTLALCDFDGDNAITAADLAAYIQAWSYKDSIKGADIYPLQDTLPYVRVNPDAKLNSLDLLQMIKVWYYYQEKKELPKVLSYNIADFEKINISFRSGDNKFSLPIKIEKPIIALRVIANYNPNSFKFDSIAIKNLSSKDEGFFLTYDDNENGRLVIDFADISNPQEFNIKLNAIINCSFDRLAKKDSLLITTIGYDNNFKKTFEKAYVYAMKELPAAYVLRQNYPNPFNPETYIEFELPEAAKVTLEVFDILGRKIVTLLNEKKEAGAYKAIFRASDYNLTSGIYFYRIRANSFIKTNKMILIK